MGLPVHLIISTLEEHLQIDDEDPVGDHEEDDDEGQGAEDYSEVKVELVEVDYGANWLVVDGVHILHKKREYSNETKWRCSGIYHFKCPFFQRTKMGGRRREDGGSDGPCLLPGKGDQAEIEGENEEQP